MSSAPSEGVQRDGGRRARPELRPCWRRSMLRSRDDTRDGAAEGEIFHFPTLNHRLKMICQRFDRLPPAFRLPLRG